MCRASMGFKFLHQAFQSDEANLQSADLVRERQFDIRTVVERYEQVYESLMVRGE